MTASLARRLVEPDYRSAPQSVQTYGPEVADLAALAGFAPDPQQELALDLLFAIRPDGKAAAFEFAVVCCRQNLKTGLFKQATLGWLFVTDQRLVVWSAHEMRTTREAIRDLTELIRGTPVLRRRLKPTPNEGIYNANGEESIELATGQRVMFKARTTGGGRGLSGDKVILDEAFALRADHMGSLLPALIARPDPQVVYGSSAGKADSDVLHDLRDRGRAGSSPRLAYLEWCAPPTTCATPTCAHPKSGAEGCALDREDLIRHANPTLTTGRITLETIRGLRQALPSGEFARECLGWWDEPVGRNKGALSDAAWAALADPGAPRGGSVVFGLDVAEDRAAWVAVAWRRADGAAQVMLADEGPTPAFRAAERCAELVARWGGSVVPPKAFEDELERVGVDVTPMKQGEFSAACGAFADAVTAGQVWHGNQPALNEAVRAARWRSAGTGGERAWQLKDAPEVGPLAAATRALHGLVTADEGVLVW